MELSKAV